MTPDPLLSPAEIADSRAEARGHYRAAYDAVRAALKSLSAAEERAAEVLAASGMAADARYLGRVRQLLHRTGTVRRAISRSCGAP